MCEISPPSFSRGQQTSLSAFNQINVLSHLPEQTLRLLSSSRPQFQSLLLFTEKAPGTDEGQSVCARACVCVLSAELSSDRQQGSAVRAQGDRGANQTTHSDGYSLTALKLGPISTVFMLYSCPTQFFQAKATFNLEKSKKHGTCRSSVLENFQRLAIRSR